MRRNCCMDKKAFSTGNSGGALWLSSPAFQDSNPLPLRCTGRGADLSPELNLSGLSPAAVSLAVVMDDLDIPVFGVYNHWIIWNLPAASTVPPAMSAGAEPPSGARQGIGYGGHCYAGPKIPRFLRKAHRYRFTAYALDCKLDLSSNAKKSNLLNAMSGHILQTATLIGTHQNR